MFTLLFADDPVAVAVAHEPVRGVRTVHGRDPVPARLLARDPAVAVVVVAGERIVPGRCRGSGLSRACRRCRARDEIHLRAVASGEDPIERRGLAAVDGEAVGSLHLEHSPREPAPVPVRQPLARVPAGFLVAVHLRGGEGEVPEVLGELPSRPPVRRAQSGIVPLAGRHNVLDVSVPGGAEARARVRPVHRAEFPHDVLLHGLRVRIVGRPVVRRTAVFGRDGQSAPSLGRRRAGERDRREDAEHPAPQASTATFTSGLCSRSLVSIGPLHRACSCRRRCYTQRYQHLRSSLSDLGREPMV